MSDWHAVVYGRTLRVDKWWRVVPEGLSTREWLGTAVTAVLGGGQRLERPRYLLARSHGYWLTGIACQANVLSATMNSDGQRQLHTFVGWAATETTAIPPPPLATLKSGSDTWLRDTYKRWVGPDWERYLRDLREPHVSPGEEAPWANGSAGPDEPVRTPGLEPPDLQVPDGAMLVFPDVDDARVWTAGRTLNAPFCLIVGWPTLDLPIPAGVTHACVAGVDTAKTIKVRAPLGHKSGTEPPEPTKSKILAMSERSAAAGAGAKPAKPDAAESEAAIKRPPRRSDKQPQQPSDNRTGRVTISYEIKLIISKGKGKGKAVLLDWSYERNGWILPTLSIGAGESILDACNDWLYRFYGSDDTDWHDDEDPPASYLCLVLLDRRRGEAEHLTLVFELAMPELEYRLTSDPEAKADRYVLLPSGETDCLADETDQWVLGEIGGLDPGTTIFRESED